MPAIMTPTLMSELGLDGLTREIRQRLAHELIDSLAVDITDEDDFELSDEWKAELERRIKSANEHPELGKSWEEVKAEVLEKLRCSK